MSDIATVYFTSPSSEVAREIAVKIVSEGMAACVNILGPCESIYRWEGKIEQEQEWAGIVKTSRRRVEAVIARIQELHPYECPAITSWNVDTAAKGYLSWVAAQLVPPR